HALMGAEPLAVERDPRDKWVDAQDLLWVQVLEREDGGHDLRRRGDRPAPVRPLRPEDAAAPRIDENGLGGADPSELSVLEPRRARQEQRQGWDLLGGLPARGQLAKPRELSLRDRAGTNRDLVLRVRLSACGRPSLRRRERPSGDEDSDGDQDQRAFRPPAAPAPNRL